MSERPSMRFNKFQKRFQKWGNLWVERRGSSPYWERKPTGIQRRSNLHPILRHEGKKVLKEDKEEGVIDFSRHLSFFRGIFPIKSSYFDDRCENFPSVIFFFECVYRFGPKVVWRVCGLNGGFSSSSFRGEWTTFHWVLIINMFYGHSKKNKQFFQITGNLNLSIIRFNVCKLLRNSIKLNKFKLRVLK